MDVCGAAVPLGVQQRVVLVDGLEIGVQRESSDLDDSVLSAEAGRFYARA